MVADLCFWAEREPTGHGRMRFEKRRWWFGVRVIFEYEARFEFCRLGPSLIVVRAETRYVRGKPWRFIGRPFYTVGTGQLAPHFDKDA